MLLALWRDESGAVLSTELIMLMVLTVIGTTVGLVALRDAINAQLADVAGAIAAIDPSFSFDGLSITPPANSPIINTTGTPTAFVAGSAFFATVAGKAGDQTFAPANVLSALAPGEIPTP